MLFIFDINLLYKNCILLFRIVFSLFFIMNLIFWANGSSAAVPFSTLIALLALWFGVSVPLTFIGAYFGFKKRVKIIYKFISFYYSMFVNNWDDIGFRASGTNKSNSSANTRAKFLHTTNTRSHHGWCPAIWLHIYTIILYT